MLKSSLGSFQLFTLAFGTIAGIAWVFLTGPWLQAAGSLGAVLALALGAALMLPIVVVYASLAQHCPGRGGEILYAREGLGESMSFLAGWLLTACYIALVTFVMISVEWLLEVVLANVGLQLGIVLPATRATSMLLTALAYGAIVLANIRGVRAAAALQDWIVLIKVSAVLMLVGLAIVVGKIRNLAPYLPASGDIAVRGIANVLVTAPFLYAGFNTAVQAMVDLDRTQLSLVRRAFLTAIPCAAAFYCVIVLSVSISLPRSLLLAQDLPALTGLAAGLHSPAGEVAVALVALLALAACWNAVFLAGTKVLGELARRHYLPHWFESRDARGLPLGSALGVVGSSLALSTLGRKAVLITVNTVSLFMSVLFILSCLSLIKIAGRPTRDTAKVPQWTARIALLLALGLVALSIVQMMSVKGVPPELVFVGIWLSVGLGAFVVKQHRVREG